MASIITATTANGLVSSADNSGVLQLASGSGNLVTVPSVTGTAMVSGNMPAFRASASAAQSITNGTNTKITLDVEIFDTNNNFASSRFTPTVEGYYLFAAEAQLNVAFNNSTVFAQIMKNGISIGTNGGTGTTASYAAVHITSLTYMNGTTDYVELFMQTNSGTLSTATTVFASYDALYFQGFLVRAA